MTSLIQDFRFGLRLLAKRPGFSFLAILALALGIGANTAAFSLVNALLLRPLALEEPERLVSVYSKDVKNPDSYRAFSYPNYADLRRDNPALSSLMAQTMAMVGLAEGESTRRAFAGVVSSNYFETLGARMFLGRAFLPEEERPDAAIPVVVVSYEYWRRQGSDPSLVGKTIRVNGSVCTVVGVTAEGFSGTTALVSPEIWMPLGMYGRVMNDFGDRAGRSLADRSNHDLMLMGRLKPGLTAQTAEPRLAVRASRLAEDHPAENRDQTFVVRPIPRLSISTSPPSEGEISVLSILLVGMSGVVLLIACLNLANMLLARGASRGKEFAIRTAVGGSRRRIVRQLLVEGLILSLFGGVVGLFAAQAGAKLLVASLQSIAPLTIVFHEGPDVRILAATLVFSLLSTILFGLGPAWKLSRPNVVSELKESAGEDARTGRFGFLNSRNLLVVSQLALSLALLTAAGLFVRGAFKAGDIDPGFSLDNQLIVETDPSLIGLDETRGREIFRSLQERFSALPGVESVSSAATVPFGMVSQGRRVMRAEEIYDPRDPDSRAKAVSARFNIVGPRYFETIGSSMVRGRSFEASDSDPSTPAVAIVDDTLAEELWPGQDPVGRRIRFVNASSVNSDDAPVDATEVGAEAEPMEVVGVARNLKSGLFIDADSRQVYVPLGQRYQSDMHFHLRFSPTDEAGEAALAAAVREEMGKVEAALPVLALKTMRTHLEESFELWVVRTGARLFSVFGAMALFLAVVGLYGVRAYTVARRTREIGIRIALGATTGQALRLILREGLVLSFVGLALGLLLSILAGRLISGFLFQVGATDAPTLTTATVILLLVSMLACYFPARRAARIDPLEALRHE